MSRKKYTEADFHEMARKTNISRWSFTIAMIAWCVVAVIMMARSSEPELIALPEYTQDGRQILAQTSGPLHWPGNKVDLYYNSTGAPEDAGSFLAYTIWSWGQRIGLEITYRGLTYETQIDGAIVVNWQTPLDMFIARDNLFVLGYASSRYYPSSSELVKSSIYLRTDLTGDSLRSVAMHELGHSTGIRGHGTDPNGVMYTSAPRYTITASDAKLTAYEHDYCHAEVMPNGEVYLPGIQGAGVTLHEVDGALMVKHEHHSGEYCTGSLGSDLVVTIPDVRGMDESYSNVVLTPYMGGWEIQSLEVVE